MNRISDESSFYSRTEPNEHKSFYQKEMLPKVEYPYEPEANMVNGVQKVYEAEDKNTYEAFQNMIKEFIGSDCWAMTVNDEVIFDSYLDNSKSIRSFIEEDVIRDKILDNPHQNLLVYLHRRKSNAHIRIYMFYSEPWTLNIEYVYLEKKFYISYSQSVKL